MKELSIKEKAKRYDEALDEAKAIYEIIRKDLHPVIEQIFPELKESEDERIRKALRKRIIRYDPNNEILIKEEGISQKQFLAWLDKQDSHYTFEIKEGHWYKCVCDYMLNNSDSLFKYGKLYYCRRNWRLEGEIDERNVKDIGVNGYKSFFRPATNQEIKDWLEKQGEKKPTDKVESKFKVGDWVIIDGETLHITNVTEKGYSTEEGGHIPFRCEKGARLWTINEAKDGDVLVCESGWTCIFKALVNDETFSSYCFMDSTGWFCGLGSECHTLKEEFVKAYNGKIQPATKEQRDFFFVKMQEAGYEWNSDKKKLHKLIKE